MSNNRNLSICVALLIKLLTSALLVEAQSQSNSIIESGQLEFERNENVYFFLDNYYDANDVEMKKYITEYKKQNPRFKSSTFTLQFDKEKSFYLPNKNVENTVDFLSSYASTNTIEYSFGSHITSAQKRIFGVTYLINDTSKKINWKLTGETREIAGFLCRRANAVILDSVYVVAFYTDQILPKGGPECFNGLPGMILGVALPNEHITWFAKKYSSEDNRNLSDHASLRGKKITRQQLPLIIQEQAVAKSSQRLYNFINRRIQW